MTAHAALDDREAAARLEQWRDCIARIQGGA